MSTIVKNAVIKVVFKHTLSNGNNYCWFKVSRSAFSYMVKYWRAQNGFFYLKIYAKLPNGLIGGQIGYISLSNSNFSG